MPEHMVQSYHSNLKFHLANARVYRKRGQDSFYRELRKLATEMALHWRRMMQITGGRFDK